MSHGVSSILFLFVAAWIFVMGLLFMPLYGLGLYFIPPALLFLIAGVGLLKQKRWARVVSVVLSCFLLLFLVFVVILPRIFTCPRLTIWGSVSFDFASCRVDVQMRGLLGAWYYVIPSVLGVLGGARLLFIGRDRELKS